MSTYSQQDIQNAQRAAFALLQGKHLLDEAGDKIIRDGKALENPFYTHPKLVTVPAVLIQEQQLTTATQNYVFDFSTKAPASTATLGNVNLGENDIAVIYGIQILLGEGANVNTRVYRSYGPLNADDVVYRGQASIQFETSTFVNKVHTSQFREVVNGNQFIGTSGLVLINPLRTFTGRLGTNTVTLALAAVSALTFTSNLFISLRLHCALGQPKA